ncbi:hypothetical protein [Thiofilum flexile]|uniref:hypothetical protein n=1 Tax=Thiofilum flexile TaxID=125627 RepID=UPI000371D78B|nr:hypothetical protein [Thiofilum flexile]
MLNLNNLTNTQSTHNLAGGTSVQQPATQGQNFNFGGAVQQPSTQGQNFNFGGAGNTQNLNTNNLLAMIMQLLQQLMGNQGNAAGGNLLGGLLGGIANGGGAVNGGGVANGGATVNGGGVANGGGNVTAGGRPTPITVPDPVTVNNGATVWGDPHFVGAEGDTYDVKGDNDKIYNLLSDKGIQLNSTFKGNLMQDYGLVVGDNEISFDKAGKLKINGEEQKEDGKYLDGMVEKKGNTVKVKAGEYNLSLINNTSYMDVKFASANVAADGVMPHGLWGQTADGDGKKRTGTDTDGSGAIERLDGTMAKAGDKTYKLYEVGSLFDVNFENFNHFWGNNGGDVVRPAAASGEAS